MIFLIIVYCKKYRNSQLGGNQPRYYTNYFGGSNLRKMAIEFTPEKKNPKFYSHAGIQLNKFQNYEFIPITPVDTNGINFYFSFLPGIRIDINEISIFYSGKVTKINGKNFTANSRSAYIDGTSENLSFFTTKVSILTLKPYRVCFRLWSKKSCLIEKNLVSRII